MRNFVYGLAIGAGLGYYFHEDIDKILRETVSKANEKIVDEKPPPVDPDVPPTPPL